MTSFRLKVGKTYVRKKDHPSGRYKTGDEVTIHKVSGGIGSYVGFDSRGTYIHSNCLYPPQKDPTEEEIKWV